MRSTHSHHHPFSSYNPNMAITLLLVLLLLIFVFLFMMISAQPGYAQNSAPATAGKRQPCCSSLRTERVVGFARIATSLSVADPEKCSRSTSERVV